MMTHRLAACALALACLASAPALAAAVSFVSVRGTDTGTCAAIATPCRTFAYALGQTSTHGEIFAIAPGNYGPVTINKSISITGTVDGAGINTAAGVVPDIAQISIAAGANDLVYLTGLTLDGSAAPADTKGVFISSAGRVIIRKCTMRNYSSEFGTGVSVDGARLLLQDDALSNANDNIQLFFGSPTVIHRVSSVNARRAAIIERSVAVPTISESSLAGSQDGIISDGGFFLTRSAISGNSGFGVSLPPGQPGSSAGDNLIRGNGTNVGFGTLTNIGRR